MTIVLFILHVVDDVSCLCSQIFGWWTVSSWINHDC